MDEHRDDVGDRFDDLISALAAAVALVEGKVRAAQGDGLRTLRLVEARLALEAALT